jgi:F-type H+-transporting ATPase subunit b
MFEPEAVAGYAVTAIFTVINLLITYLILKRFLFKPILKILRKRKSEVESELNQAEQRLIDADTRLHKASERMDASVHEAATIVPMPVPRLRLRAKPLSSKPNRKRRPC